MTTGYIDPERRAALALPASKIPYVVAVVVMMALGVIASTALFIARPLTGITAAETMTAVLAVFGFLTPTTLSLLAFMKSQETHLSVNSRLDAFMTMAKVAAHAQGLNEGRTAGRIAADQRTDLLAHTVNAPRADLIADDRQSDGIPHVEAPVVVVAPKP